MTDYASFQDDVPDDDHGVIRGHLVVTTTEVETVEIGGSRYYDALPHPNRHRRCRNCERCSWNPGSDCGRIEHPHCPHCGHCRARHFGDAEMAIYERRHPLSGEVAPRDG
jgi:hypothetical protein